MLLSLFLGTQYRILALYEQHDVKDRLQNLTPTMLQGNKAAPKLRASAAACRALVPLTAELATLHLSLANPIEQAARVGMYHLNQCYVLALSTGPAFDHDALKQHSIDFALQYVALETHFAGHLFGVRVILICSPAGDHATSSAGGAVSCRGARSPAEEQINMPATHRHARVAHQAKASPLSPSLQ